MTKAQCLRLFSTEDEKAIITKAFGAGERLGKGLPFASATEEQVRKYVAKKLETAKLKQAIADYKKYCNKKDEDVIALLQAAVKEYKNKIIQDQIAKLQAQLID